MRDAPHLAAMLAGVRERGLEPFVEVVDEQELALALDAGAGLIGVNARDLDTLDDKFGRDVASMPPAAASYVRRHPCLSPAWMKKWRVGVLPLDGGGDKRGWSVRGQLLYPVLSEDGKLLAWVARDPQFETKEQAFNAFTPDERAKENEITSDLVYGVMRQESGFDPEVISSARAVGLLQLLPETARTLVSEDRSDDATRLTSPPINITLGARYLRHLCGP